MSDEKRKCRCNKCGQATEHVVLYSSPSIGESLPVPGGQDVEWSTTYSTVQCCGCKDISFEEFFWCSEYDEPQVTYYPPRVSRKRPTWFNQLPTEYFPLLDEIYSALHAGNRILAMMGARAILDVFITNKVGDRGDFANGLNALVEENYLARVNREVIEVAINAGNAAAHRAYNPPSEIMNDVMDIVENLIQHDALVSSTGRWKNKVPKRVRAKVESKGTAPSNADNTNVAETTIPT